MVGISLCPTEDGGGGVGEPPVTTEAYYLDFANGLDGNDGRSTASPWLTFAHALNQIPDGIDPDDVTLYIKRGTTYTATTHVPRIENRTGITIDAYGAIADGDPTWDGQNTYPASAFSNDNGDTVTLGLIELRNCRYFRVANQKVVNSRNAGITIRNDGNPAHQQSANNIVEWCTTYNTRAWGVISCGINHDAYPQPAYDQNATVRYCHVEKACQAKLEDTSPDPNTAAGEAITASSADGFQAYGNRVHDYGKEGIVVNNCDNCEVYDNWVYDADKTVYGGGTGAGIYVDAASKGATNCKVYRNVVSDDAFGISIASESGGVLDNVTVENNTIYNIISVPILLAGDAGGPLGSGSQSNMKIYHNFMDCQNTSQSSLRITETDDAKLSGVEIKGNIFFRDLVSVQGMITYATTGIAYATIDRNMFWSGQVETVPGTLGTNSLSENPDVIAGTAQASWPYQITAGAQHTTVSTEAANYFPSASEVRAAIDAQGGVTDFIDATDRTNPTSYGPYS